MSPHHAAVVANWSPFVSPIHLMPTEPRHAKLFPRMAAYCVHPSGWRLAKLMGAAALGI